MPYVTQEVREQLDKGLNKILEKGKSPADAGQLNYVITKIIDHYINDVKGGVRYTHLNEVVGVLECAKLELYRRVAAEYEDQKIAENGDVYSVL